MYDVYDYDAPAGDCRRCPAHGCATSSPDGMFDAPCGACESEMEAADAARDWEALSPDAKAVVLAEVAAIDAARAAAWASDAPF